MASPTDVTTAAAADDPDTGLRAIRALRDLADRLEVLQVVQRPGPRLVLAADRRRPRRQQAGRPQEARHLEKGPLTCSNASPPRPGRSSSPRRRRRRRLCGPSGSSRCTCCSRSPAPTARAGARSATAGIDHERLLSAVRSRGSALDGDALAVVGIDLDAGPRRHRRGVRARRPGRRRQLPGRAPVVHRRQQAGPRPRPSGWSGGARRAGSTAGLGALRRALDRATRWSPALLQPAGHRPRRAPRPGGRLRATARSGPAGPCAARAPGHGRRARSSSRSWLPGVQLAGAPLDELVADLVPDALGVAR